MNKIAVCKHCLENFDISTKPKGWMANHSRWCSKNPKLDSYKINLASVEAMHKKCKETGYLNQFSKAKLEGKNIPAHSRKGIPCEGHPHNKETIELIRKKALASNHRRLRKKQIEYKGIKLDSSWELALAKRLDYLNIVWSRPEPIKWVDDQGIYHHYFPDFYLNDYNLFLDPKNPAAVKAQQEKLKCLKEQIPNLIIIDSLSKIYEFTVPAPASAF